jgi:aspartate/methionine/tyrosine aminotransferase
MTGPQTLSRPLAARVTDLPAPRELEPGSPIPQAVIKAGIQALADGKTKYTDRPGIFPLRSWVADYLKDQFDVDVSPDEVTITCGETEARFVTVKHLGAPGSCIVYAGEPPPIDGVAKLVGVQEVTTTVGDAARVSLLYLTPRDDLHALGPLLKLVEQHNWWIVYDVSGGIPETGLDTHWHPAQKLELAPRTVTIGGLSDQLPGWRIGWMAGSEQALKLRAYKQSMTICSTSVSQWAALGLVGGDA